MNDSKPYKSLYPNTSVSQSLKSINSWSTSETIPGFYRNPYTLKNPTIPPLELPEINKQGLLSKPKEA